MKTNNWQTSLLIVAVLALAVVPLFLARGAEFSGSDDQASEAISQIQPGFEPWFHPLFEPPSAEIESLLFAVQASIGTAFIAFFFGYKVGLRRTQRGENALDRPVRI